MTKQKKEKHEEDRQFQERKINPKPKDWKKKAMKRIRSEFD